ncbi:MAG TPA: tetratricopeptide repeat protein [Thermoguttaceae bacterium]|nr:tetratricopeptide repeat protein [Thermoguttaceae bacterium]
MAALREHQAGRLDRAEEIYRQVLRARPENADALHLLGVVAHQRGDHEAAVKLIRRAVANNPEVPAFFCNLGLACQALKRHDEAVDHYQHALRIRPEYPEALYNLGNALKEQGRIDQAEDCYRRATQLQPDYVEAHNNLGLLLQARGDFQAASECFDRALRIRPAFAEAHCNLGFTHQSEGALDKAAACYRAALGIQPDYAEAHNNLGTVLALKEELHEAEKAYRLALENKPDCAEAHGNLGGVLAKRGELEKAAASFRRAAELEPDRVTWELRIATLCPPVFPSNEAIDEYRRNLLAGVNRLSEQGVKVHLPGIANSGIEPPFNLMYHGRNDRPIKEAYAGMFRHSFPHEIPAVRSGRPRVGFVVTHGHEGIFLLLMQGILEHIDPEAFEAVVVCPRLGSAVIRSAIRRETIRVLPLPGRFDRMVDAVRGARFDLLFYWEVGTDSVNYFLPFLRLAPVQCTSAGIPVTSGIPQMDYYLSDELWESEDSDKHYTETLVRTKTNLAYVPRFTPPPTPKTREDFGFSPHQHVYLCAQRIEKLHPDFDPVLAEILRRDGSGSIVIVKDEAERRSRALHRRFSTTISDVLDRIIFLPRLSFPDYLGLVRASDVLLDTIHYSGGTTTYHGFSFGKPIVTLPLERHAGRTVYACYRKMGIDDCIASSPEQYAEIAVRLGSDVEYRSFVTERIREFSPMLFENVQAVRELEQVFQELIARSRSNGNP